MSMTSPIDESSLFQRVTAALESGEFVRGGKLLPERELCDRLNVGRYGLRQALARLEAEGTIWRRQGQGTFVSAIHPPRAEAFLEQASDTSPAEMMEVRIEFEPVLARFCALRASREQMQLIRQKAVFATAADTSRSFEHSDFAFHRAIAEGANNVLLLAMYDLVTATLRQADWRVARQRTFSPPRLSEVASEHEDIVTAILERDPRAAETAMREHLRSVYDYLQQR